MGGGMWHGGGGRGGARACWRLCFCEGGTAAVMWRKGGRVELVGLQCRYTRWTGGTDGCMVAGGGRGGWRRDVAGLFNRAQMSVGVYPRRNKLRGKRGVGCMRRRGEERGRHACLPYAACYSTSSGCFGFVHVRTSLRVCGLYCTTTRQCMACKDTVKGTIVSSWHIKVVYVG